MQIIAGVEDVYMHSYIRLTDKNVTFACQSSQQGTKPASASDAQSAFILAL